jgi:hypothetical protein
MPIIRNQCPICEGPQHGGVNETESLTVDDEGVASATGPSDL